MSKCRHKRDAANMHAARSVRRRRKEGREREDARGILGAASRPRFLAQRRRIKAPRPSPSVSRDGLLPLARSRRCWGCVIPVDRPRVLRSVESEVVKVSVAVGASELRIRGIECDLTAPW